jgi:hypothetical protein
MVTGKTKWFDRVKRCAPRGKAKKGFRLRTASPRQVAEASGATLP